ETRTILRRRAPGQPAHLNFAVVRKLQRKFSPLYAKRIAAGWHARTLGQLTNYVEHPLVDLFRKTSAETVADFCLEMYRGMGLLDGLGVVRSSDPEVRRRACDVNDFFVDVPYEGEIVRARARDGVLYLHEGGDSFITLPAAAPGFKKEQISPTRDTRLRWRGGSASRATRRWAAAACWRPRWARTWRRADTTCTSSPTSVPSACPRTHRTCTSIPSRSTSTSCSGSPTTPCRSRCAWPR